MKHYLAIDIGASGGVMLLVGRTASGGDDPRTDRLVTEPIYRFDNGYVSRGGHDCWDLERLLAEIETGLEELARRGISPVSLGIDTWGVDFVLLDERQQIIGDAVAYRDHRTDDWPERLADYVPDAELYRVNGLQRINFNTIYQFMALAQTDPDQLERARHFLMLPDYLHYRLSGVMTNEYTNASTTGFLNARTRGWDRELLERLGLPTDIYCDPKAPGSQRLPLTGRAARLLGSDSHIVVPATHDTGSAYVALPARDERTVYLSSGTWSLIGDILPEPVLTEAAMRANYTNEGGYGGTIRFLKNIMGLWLAQSLRRELFPGMPWDDLEVRAKASRCDLLIDVNDTRFLAPASMTEAVRGCLAEQGHAEGITDIDLVRIVYRSLAHSYRAAVEELASLTGKDYHAIHITGGGCRSDWLNRLCAEATGLEVHTGPAEGSAIGNAIVQMLADGEIRDLAEAHALVRRSETIGCYPVG
ncbi:MAG: rhamnulokinase family protein [Bacillota bacterium]|nr:rhamnulokinase family protein [Bacillota bacterium]